MLDNFIYELRSQLENPLPGKIAHMKMSPRDRKDKKIDLEQLAEPKRGGVLILFYEEDGRIKFPLIQRPEYNGVHSGQVSLPGGKMEDGETLIETAFREAREEIGVEEEKMEVIGLLTQFYIWVSNFKVQPVIAFSKDVPRFRLDMHEVEEVIEADLEDLLSEKNVKQKEIHTSLGFKIKSPYYDVQGKVVWGATAMMLSELTEIIKRMDFFKKV